MLIPNDKDPIFLQRMIFLGGQSSLRELEKVVECFHREGDFIFTRMIQGGGVFALEVEFGSKEYKLLSEHPSFITLLRHQISGEIVEMYFGETQGYKKHYSKGCYSNCKTVTTCNEFFPHYMVAVENYKKEYLPGMKELLSRFVTTA